MKSGSSLAVGLAALAGLAVLVATLADTKSSAEPPALSDGSNDFIFKPDQPPAPEISFVGDGERPLTLDDFRGRLVLLNFWATWCAPCVREMPALDRLQQRVGKDRFEVLTLSMDRKGLPAVEEFFDVNKLENLSPYVDTKSKSMRTFGVRGLPTTFLIDRSGIVIGSVEGPVEWDGPEAQAFIEFFLEDPILKARN